MLRSIVLTQPVTTVKHLQYCSMVRRCELQFHLYPQHIHVYGSITQLDHQQYSLSYLGRKQGGNMEVV